MPSASAAVKCRAVKKISFTWAGPTRSISFFTPEEMLALAREAGFKDVRHVSSGSLAERYFSGRADGLRPPDGAEELLLAST